MLRFLIITFPYPYVVSELSPSLDSTIHQNLNIAQVSSSTLKLSDISISNMKILSVFVSIAMVVAGAPAPAPASTIPGPLPTAKADLITNPIVPFVYNYAVFTTYKDTQCTQPQNTVWAGEFDLKKCNYLPGSSLRIQWTRSAPGNPSPNGIVCRLLLKQVKSPVVRGLLMKLQCPCSLMKTAYDLMEVLKSTDKALAAWTLVTGTPTLWTGQDKPNFYWITVADWLRRDYSICLIGALYRIDTICLFAEQSNTRRMPEGIL
jgi:hypothetical protein